MAQMDHLFFTLYRGFAGKGKYQKVLTHFKLTKSGTTVRVPNTFENRAAAKKVRIVQLSHFIPLTLIPVVVSCTPWQPLTVDSAKERRGMLRTAALLAAIECTKTHW